jgi:hypothetical protein
MQDLKIRKARLCRAGACRPFPGARRGHLRFPLIVLFPIPTAGRAIITTSSQRRCVPGERIARKPSIELDRLVVFQTRGGQRTLESQASLTKTTTTCPTEKRSKKHLFKPKYARNSRCCRRMIDEAQNPYRVGWFSLVSIIRAPTAWLRRFRLASLWQAASKDPTAAFKRPSAGKEAASAPELMAMRSSCGVRCQEIVCKGLEGVCDFLKTRGNQLLR